MTTFRWYLLGLALLFGAYVAVEYYRPKPLDWTPTLENDDKIPYGTFVLYDLLPSLLSTQPQQVRTIRVPVYSQIEGVDEDETVARAVAEEASDSDVPLADSTTTPASWPADSAGAEVAATQATPGTDTTTTGPDDYGAGLADGGYVPATYVFVANRFELSRLDCRSLLRHVARGNDAFIAAESFNSFFADTLGFNTTESLAPTKQKTTAPRPDSATGPLAQASEKLLTDSVRLRLRNPALARQLGFNSFALPPLAATSRLQATPAMPAATTELATDSQGQSVLLRVPHGRGHIYLCSVPLAFSNYFVLQPRTGNFAFAALSYLPTGRQVWWDEYQKQGRRGEQSLLRVLLEHEALRTAFYLTLAGALLFVLVEARRRQRVIPVLKPLPNTTLLFTRTVAGLYRQGASHALIAEKKIGLFQEYLRTRYHEPTLDLTDETTRERIAQKSGIARAEVDALVRRMHFVLTAPQVSDGELLALNKAINAFRQQAA